MRFAMLARHSSANPSLVELGGAVTRVADQVRNSLRPSQSHVIDYNQSGIDCLSERVGDDPSVGFWNRNVSPLDPPLQLDVVLDGFRTRETALAHIRLLKRGGLAEISFPTLPQLHWAARAIAERVGQWLFRDECPLWLPVVKAAIDGQAEWLHREVVWPMILTQTLVAIRKRGSAALSTP